MKNADFPLYKTVSVASLVPYARNARTHSAAQVDKIGKYMIGMSVPPKMAEAVARAVIDQWLQPENSHAP